MKQKSKRLAALTVTVIALSSSLVAKPAQASGAVAGATEPTQLLNHVELLHQVAQGATQIQNQINQYTTMIQQLKQLPPQLIGQTTMPWQQALAGYQALYQAVNGVQSSYASAYQTLSFRKGQMDALNMNPTAYLNAEMQLADARGGYYRDAINRDLQVLNTATQRSQALQQVTQSIPTISSSVQGLQTLSTQSSMMAGELQDIKAAVVQQKIASENEGYKKSQEEQLSINQDQSILQEMNRRANSKSGKSEFDFKSW